MAVSEKFCYFSLLQSLPVSPYTGFRLLARHVLATSNFTMESATLTWEIGNTNTPCPVTQSCYFILTIVWFSVAPQPYAETYRFNVLVARAHPRTG